MEIDEKVLEDYQKALQVCEEIIAGNAKKLLLVRQITFSILASAHQAIAPLLNQEIIITTLKEDRYLTKIKLDDSGIFWWGDGGYEGLNLNTCTKFELEQIDFQSFSRKIAKHIQQRLEGAGIELVRAQGVAQKLQSDMLVAQEELKKPLI